MGSSTSTSRDIEACRCPTASPDPGVRCRTRLRPRGSPSSILLIAETHGYRLHLVDHPPAFDRDGHVRHPVRRPSRQRVAVRAAVPGGARAPSRRGIGRRTCSTSTTGTPCRRCCSATACSARDPASGAPRSCSRPQPRVPRLDARANVPELGLGAIAWSGRRGKKRRPGPAAHRHRAGGAREYRQPGLRRGGAQAGDGHGPRRRAPGARRRFFGILNGLDTDLWDPATDAALPPRYSRADRPARRAAGRRCSRRSASTLPTRGPCSRWSGVWTARRASISWPRRRLRSWIAGSGWPSSARATTTWSRRCGAVARHPWAGADRADGALRSRPRPPSVRRRRRVPHAVALRAVRYRPDGRAPLRHAADRPRDRRAARHGHRRRCEPGGGTGFAFEERLPMRSSMRAADSSRGSTPAGPAWEACSIVAWPSTSTGEPRRLPPTSPRTAARSRSGAARRPRQVPEAARPAWPPGGCAGVNAGRRGW